MDEVKRCHIRRQIPDDNTFHPSIHQHGVPADDRQLQFFKSRVDFEDLERIVLRLRWAEKRWQTFLWWKIYGYESRIYLHDQPALALRDAYHSDQQCLR